MSNSTTYEVSLHVDHLETYKRLLLAYEFITEAYMDEYVDFLRGLEGDKWDDFQDTIAAVATEFDVNADEVNEAIQSFVKVPYLL